jgi:hypothetical protein
VFQQSDQRERTAIGIPDSYSGLNRGRQKIFRHIGRQPGKQYGARCWFSKKFGSIHEAATRCIGQVRNQFAQQLGAHLLARICFGGQENFPQ